MYSYINLIKCVLDSKLLPMYFVFVLCGTGICINAARTRDPNESGKECPTNALASFRSIDFDAFLHA